MAKERARLQITRIAFLVLILGIAVATFQVQHVYSADHANGNTCELCQVPSFDQALATNISSIVHQHAICENYQGGNSLYVPIAHCVYHSRGPPTQV